MHCVQRKATEQNSLGRAKYLKAVLERHDHHGSRDPSADCEKILKRVTAAGVSLPPGARILDLGCGLGRHAIYLAEKGFDSYGVDRNPDFIEVGATEAARRGIAVKLTTALAEELPYPDRWFDLCIANSMLEHVEDWKATLAQASRVLKPGGAVYISTANIVSPFQHEVRYMPFFPYLPGPVKRLVLRVIVDKAPALVHHSLTPAKNWFLPSGLRRHLVRKLGFARCYDLLDLLHVVEPPPRYRRLKPLLSWGARLPPVLRDVLYVGANGLVLLGIKP